MSVSSEQALLAEIQALALSGSKQTGYRITHDVQGWGDGNVWSSVRVIEGAYHPLLSLRAIINDGDDSVPGYDMSGDRCTLTEQLARLAAWIDAHRKQEVVTSPGAAIGSEADELPAKRTVEQWEAE